MYCARNATKPNETALVIRDDVPGCNPEERLWYYFFLSSVGTMVAGLLMVLFGRLVAACHKKASQRSSNQMKKVADTNRAKEKSSNSNLDKQDDIGCVTAAKDWAGELISGQTNSGRILVSS